MAKKKRKMTEAQKRKKKEYEYIFVNGKQKRIKRPPTIDGMDVDDFIKENADHIWLHQNEMWEYLEEIEDD
jgi:hypothetical protein